MCEFLSVRLIKRQNAALKNDESVFLLKKGLGEREREKDHLQNLKKQPQLVLQGFRHKGKTGTRNQADESPSSL